MQLKCVKFNQLLNSYCGCILAEIHWLLLKDTKEKIV